MKTNVKKTVLAGLFLALTIILPNITGAINPEIGSLLSPIHIPVFLAAFMCGPLYGGLVGFIAPFLKMAIYGMPPINIAIAMSFEMLAYGVVTGALYLFLSKKYKINVYVALLSGMVAGRIVYTLANYALYFIYPSSSGESFLFMAYLSTTFFNAIPEFVLHTAIIPTIVIMTQRFVLPREMPAETV